MLWIEFVEFKGVDRKAVRSNIQDPGSTRMQLQVRDVDAAVTLLKAAGGTVMLATRNCASAGRPNIRTTAGLEVKAGSSTPCSPSC